MRRVARVSALGRASAHYECLRERNELSMSDFLRKSVRLLGGAALLAGVSLVAGAVGGVCGALGALSELSACGGCSGCDGCDGCECDCECDDAGDESDEADAEAANRRGWVERMSRRAREARECPDGLSAPSGEVDPEVRPVAEDEGFDWDACLDYENPDDIPGADMVGEDYF